LANEHKVELGRKVAGTAAGHKVVAAAGPIDCAEDMVPVVAGRMAVVSAAGRIVVVIDREIEDMETGLVLAAAVEACCTATALEDTATTALRGQLFVAADRRATEGEVASQDAAA
jgi:hypothetical protein